MYSFPQITAVSLMIKFISVDQDGLVKTSAVNFLEYELASRKCYYWFKQYLFFIQLRNDTNIYIQISLIRFYDCQCGLFRGVTLLS